MNPHEATVAENHAKYRWVASRKASEYAVCIHHAALDVALGCTKGRYQRDVILGRECWDGTTLSVRRTLGPAALTDVEIEGYATSRVHLFERMTKVVRWCTLGPILVVGMNASEVDYHWVMAQRRRELDAYIAWKLRCNADGVVRSMKNRAAAIDESVLARREIDAVFSELDVTLPISIAQRDRR